jgi:hypothetical protein
MQCRAGQKNHTEKATYSLNYPFSMTDKIMGSFVMYMCSSAVSLHLHQTNFSSPVFWLPHLGGGVVLSSFWLVFLLVVVVKVSLG